MERNANESDRTLVVTASCELCGGTVINDECEVCGSEYINGKRSLDQYDKLTFSAIDESLEMYKSMVDVLSAQWAAAAAERDALRAQVVYFKAEILRLRKVIDPSYEPFPSNGVDHA